MAQGGDRLLPTNNKQAIMPAKVPAEVDIHSRRKAPMQKSSKEGSNDIQQKNSSSKGGTISPISHKLISEQAVPTIISPPRLTQMGNVKATQPGDPSKEAALVKIKQQLPRNGNNSTAVYPTATATPSSTNQYTTEIVKSLFGPTVGPVIQDFSCNKSRHAGRLYVGTNASCFYSNIFGIERRIVIFYSTVSQVTEYKSSGVAIHVRPASSSPSDGTQKNHVKGDAGQTGMASTTSTTLATTNTIKTMTHAPAAAASTSLTTTTEHHFRSFHDRNVVLSLLKTLVQDYQRREKSHGWITEAHLDPAPRSQTKQHCKYKSDGEEFVGGSRRRRGKHRKMPKRHNSWDRLSSDETTTEVLHGFGRVSSSTTQEGFSSSIWSSMKSVTNSSGSGNSHDRTLENGSQVKKDATKSRRKKAAKHLSRASWGLKRRSGDSSRMVEDTVSPSGRETVSTMELTDATTAASHRVSNGRLLMDNDATTSLCLESDDDDGECRFFGNVTVLNEHDGEDHPLIRRRVRCNTAPARIDDFYEESTTNSDTASTPPPDLRGGVFENGGISLRALFGSFADLAESYRFTNSTTGGDDEDDDGREFLLSLDDDGDDHRGGEKVLLSDDKRINTDSSAVEAAWAVLVESTKGNFKEVGLSEQQLPRGCDLDRFFNEFLADDAHHSIMSYQRNHIGDTEVAATAWSKLLPSESNESTIGCNTYRREVTFRHKVNAPVGPSSTTATKIQTCSRYGSCGLVLDTRTVLDDVHNADCFYVEDRIIVQQAAPTSGGAGESEPCLTLHARFQVRFVKGTMWKRIIEKMTKSEVTQWFEGYSKLITDVLERGGNNPRCSHEVDSETVVAAPLPSPMTATHLNRPTSTESFRLPLPQQPHVHNLATYAVVMSMLFVMLLLSCQVYFLTRRIASLERAIIAAKSIGQSEVDTLRREIRMLLKEKL